MRTRSRLASWPSRVESRTIRSFRIALRQVAILTSRMKQVGHRSWANAPRAVEVSDFESDSPLLEQHAIGVEKTEFGIVNVRCFRCDPVQLHDFEVTTCHEVLPRRNTNVKAPEEETIEGQCNSTDDFFQGWSNRVVSVQEDSTATMGPDLDQLNSFSSRGHLLNPFCIVAQVKV